MNSRQPTHPPQDELAQVRAEVASALREEPPDIVRLSAALERVETMLARARADLVAVVREVEGDTASTSVPPYNRGMLWW